MMFDMIFFFIIFVTDSENTVINVYFPSLKCSPEDLDQYLAPNASANWDVFIFIVNIWSCLSMSTPHLMEMAHRVRSCQGDAVTQDWHILIKCKEPKSAKHAHARSTSITTEANPFISHKGVRNHKNAHISVNICKRTAYPSLSVFDLCKAAIYLLLEWTCKHTKHKQPPRNQWHFTSFSSLRSCSSWPVWPVNGDAVSKGGSPHRCKCSSADAFTRSLCLTNSV